MKFTSGLIVSFAFASRIHRAETFVAATDVCVTNAQTMLRLLKFISSVANEEINITP